MIGSFLLLLGFDVLVRLLFSEVLKPERLFCLSSCELWLAGDARAAAGLVTAVIFRPPLVP